MWLTMLAGRGMVWWNLLEALLCSVVLLTRTTAISNNGSASGSTKRSSQSSIPDLVLERHGNLTHHLLCSDLSLLT
jgi:hypothetical protein